MRRVALLRSLSHRSFRLLFLGQAISNLGDWLNYLAIISIIVYRWHMGANALAAFSIVMFLPMILLGPVAGVWVDRWPRKATMIVCDLVRAGLVLGLVWAANIYIMLVLVVLASAVSTFFDPAKQALIRGTVPEEDLLSANSLSQTMFQVAKILGPALGGIIVLLGGAYAAFVCDSVSFLVSALFLSFLPRLVLPVATDTAEEKEAPAKGNFWLEFRAGFAYILQRRLLLAAVLSASVALFIIGTFDSMSALALQALGFDSSLFGFAVGSIGLGTVLGGLIVGQWGKRFSPLRLMALGDIGVGVMIGLIGLGIIIQLHIWPPFWTVLWLLGGLAVAGMIIPYGYLLQKETPPEMMGRVSGMANGIQTAFQFLAPLLGAVIADLFGVGNVFAVAGVALLLVGACIWLMRVSSSVAEPEQAAPGVLGE
ncbi:MFS transporter [Ktedonobacter racemifer]|uniref:Major facilitator superfamily MFS_1 n=1 Tax=Ktedonobacter racemifer DSM 44963 TaxID=485913 RepID=D6TTJ8_KTERA|nr:MFS transporter [Ktedonobacter racemifer]EFH83749.1 major facilitator superfamily MFS_1 [Ktedonobacter racemifer DSM 44963]